MDDIKWLSVISSFEVSEKQTVTDDVWRYVDSYDLPVRVPKHCPSCGVTFGKSIVPIISVSNLPYDSNRVYKDVSSCEIISVYHCIECNSLFVIKYAIISNGTSLLDEDLMKNGGTVCNIVGHLPMIQNLEHFSQFIVSKFSKFVDLYHQSEKAEFLGLTDICGMGYRKALEFLVQSYVEYKENGLPDDFDGMTLSQKITKYIRDDNIKILVKRAVWLGNDNVHIVQKHSDYSVDDMKQFILSVISYFDFEQNVQKASKIQRK